MTTTLASTSHALSAGHDLSPPGADSPVFLDRAATAHATPYRALVDALALAATQYQQGLIHSPTRTGVPLAGDGVSLSMPASAADISIHKLANVQPANSASTLPTIHGLVTVSDAQTGRPLCFLDGPEITGRRTAALSMLGLEKLRTTPVRNVLLIGTGTQAIYHVQALAALHPRCSIYVRGKSLENELKFCQRQQSVHAQMEACPAEIPADIDTVITVTTSLTPVYDLPAQTHRLVIGVGAFMPSMAEIGASTLLGSRIYVDDLGAAKAEAGDLLQAGIDWSQVQAIGQVQHTPAAQPMVYKTVGSAAWDLAAARVALQSLRQYS